MSMDVYRQKKKSLFYFYSNNNSSDGLCDSQKKNSGWLSVNFEAKIKERQINLGNLTGCIILVLHH
jgi:hypothetical protein